MGRAYIGKRKWVGMTLRQRSGLKKKEKSIRTGGRWVGRVDKRRESGWNDFTPKKRIKEEGKPY